MRISGKLGKLQVVSWNMSSKQRLNSSAIVRTEKTVEMLLLQQLSHLSYGANQHLFILLLGSTFYFTKNIPVLSMSYIIMDEIKST